MSTWLAGCHREADRLEAIVRDLVAHESPSGDRTALERCAGALVRHLQEAGASVDRREGPGAAASHVVAEWPGAGPRVLLLGHFDTVWPVGQLARQPIDVRDGRLFGPGAYDMKAGLAIGLTAARVLTGALDAGRRPRVTMLVTSDEEVGSHSSRALIEAMARESRAVLVLEPAMPSGGVKTARKGVGHFDLQLAGISAHAGVDPEKGASAIHELARQILALEALADPARGLTVNVGVVGGGTRSNVVAERADAAVDVRVTRLDDAARVEAAMRTLAARDPRVRLSVSGGINRPPMERTEGVVRLYELAREVAAGMDWALAEGMSGGGSDGNFTGAIGVPTLDGLGAMGDGAHALHEHVVLAELPRRAALVAGLLARLSDN